MKLDARAHRWSTWLVCVNAVLSTFFAELLNQSGLMSRALTCRCAPVAIINQRHPHPRSAFHRLVVRVAFMPSSGRVCVGR
jgi:hypothetical protein